MPAMTAERSLQLEVIAFISSEKPVLSIVKDKENLTSPLTSRPVAKKNLGNINTDEQFTHSSASVRVIQTRQVKPPGQSSMMTRVQRPNQPIMAWEAGNRLL